jgi:hypothetical protein
MKGNFSNNISGNSNLNIECINRTLNKIKENQEFPPILYIQVDGASNNWSKAVLSYCEIFVHKRIFKTAYISRLPVGHTHEDIDAKFGVIAIHLSRRNYFTVQEYIREIQES